MPIDDYLDELCTALEVDSLRRDEIRLEVHTHLRQHAEALARQGLSPGLAEQRAIDEFGPPEETALRFSRTSATKSRWAASRHVENVGMLLIAFGMHQGLSFLEQSLGEASRYSNINPNLLMFTANGYFGLLMIVAVPLVFFFLGVALMRHFAWARAPVIVLCLANPWLMIDLMNMSMLRHQTLWSLQGLGASGLFLFSVGIYALWAYSQPKRRPLGWAN